MSCLLGPARGMVIFIPKGSPGDPTVNTAEFDSTAEFLMRCGVTPLALEHFSFGYIPLKQKSKPCLSVGWRDFGSAMVMV